MHKYLTPVIAATAVFVAGISTANAGPVSVGIAIGIPAPMLVAPAPVYYPAPVVYAPAPVYYAPPRVVYAPPPVYYAPPRGVRSPASSPALPSLALTRRVATASSQ